MNIEVKQSIPLGRVSDLLTSALEGGSNYWYTIEKAQKPKTWSYSSFEPKGKPSPYTVDIPLNKGGVLFISDMEGDDEKKLYRLDLKAIKRGLQVMASNEPKHWGDFMSENDDAITGDVFLQCCLFGEVIYG